MIEVSVSMLLLATIVLALTTVRYHAHQHAVRADAYATAARIGLLLLESWRSMTTPADYDPVYEFADEISIETGTGPGVPAGFTGLGSYHMILENRNYYATLAYIGETATQPAVLYVGIGWKGQGSTWTPSGEYYTLTTYD